MSKYESERSPKTSAQRMEKQARKQEKRTMFFEVFEKASYFFLAFVLVASVLRISFLRDAARAAGNVVIPAGSSQYTVSATAPAAEATTKLSAEAAPEVTTAVQSTPEAPKESDGILDTNEEIALYLKNAINKVKSSAASATLLTENNSNYNSVVEVGNSPMLKRIAQSLMNRFLTPGEPNTTFTGADLQASFPPENAACNLTAADIETASCQEEGNSYRITVTLKKDVNPKSGYGSGALCSIITQEQILSATEGIINISDIRCEYDGVCATAFVEKATGNLTRLHTVLPMYLNLTALRIDCRLGLQFEEEWSVCW